MLAPNIFIGLPSKFQEKFKEGLSYHGKGINDRKMKVKNAIIFEKIIAATCYLLNVKRKDLVSPLRTREVSDARTIAIFFIRKKTRMTLMEIGKEFNRDHSTVINAIKRFRNFKETDKEFSEKARLVKSHIK